MVHQLVRSAVRIVVHDVVRTVVKLPMRALLYFYCGVHTVHAVVGIMTGAVLQ